MDDKQKRKNRTDLQVRVAAVGRRLQEDTAFRSQVVADPVGTLTAAELPPKVVEAAVHHSMPTEEVAGYGKIVVSAGSEKEEYEGLTLNLQRLLGEAGL